VIRDHAAAVKARLEEDDVLAACTYEGLVDDDAPERYCSFFINSGDRYGDRLAAPDLSADFTVTLHSVGTTPEQAQFVAEHAFAQLMNYTLAVPGRSCTMIRHTGSMATQPDDTVQPGVFFNADEFSFQSDPIA
jgi:hypothetical protein